VGKIYHNPAVKLIVGLIFKNKDYLDKTKRLLIKRFGCIDFESPVLDFNFTEYYKNEFGSGLKRVFISFKRLIPPQNISDIKILTNKFENKLSLKGKRNINIDPGYLDMAKLVLATTKDFAHRIYLSKGIYAEVTLTFQNNTFKHKDWTYPDYRTPAYIDILNSIRGIYAKQIKK
jgi:hypothetical protein